MPPQKRQQQKPKTVDNSPGIAMSEYAGHDATGRTWVAQTEAEAIEMSQTGWRRDHPEASTEDVPDGHTSSGDSAGSASSPAGGAAPS